MLELGPAAEERAEVLLRPRGVLHELRPALPFHFEQRAQRVQPAAVQARRPHRLGRFGERFAQLRHIFVVTGIFRRALLLRERECLVGAERRGKVERRGQHALAAVGRRVHLIINELLEDGCVEREALAHEAEALRGRLVVLGVIDGDGVDGRCGQRGRQFSELAPFLIFFRKLRCLRHAAVRRFDERQVLEGAGVVARAREERGDGVDALPCGPGVARERQRHQQRAARLVLVALTERQAAVPHHRAEIRRQLFARRVIAARSVLCVVLLNRRFRAAEVHDGRVLDARGRRDERQLRADNVRHFGGHGRAAVQQREADGKERRVPLGRVLPRRAAQRFELCKARRLHLRADGREIGDELRLFNAFQQAAEKEMIRVHHRIGRDKVRDQAVAVHLVAGEELLAVSGQHDKAVFAQHLPRVVAEHVLEIGKVDDVREIIRHRVRRDSGREGGIVQRLLRLHEKLPHHLGRGLTALAALRRFGRLLCAAGKAQRERRCERKRRRAHCLAVFHGIAPFAVFTGFLQFHHSICAPRTQAPQRLPSDLRRRT